MARLVDGDSALVYDTTHAPVLISTHFGPATEVLVRDYFGLMLEVLEDLGSGARYVGITDGSRSARPSPAVRRLLAELTDLYRPRFKDASLANLTVIESPVVRGAVTAIRWLSRVEWQLDIVANMEQAMTRARTILDHASIAWPAGLDPATYVRPQHPGQSEAV